MPDYGCSIMSKVKDNILNRASIRAFTSKDLEDEILEDLVEAGLAAPWAFHTHARHLCVISGHDNVQKLLKSGAIPACASPSLSGPSP